MARDRRRSTNEDAQPPGEDAAGHGLAGLHSDPRIAGLMAQRLVQRRAKNASAPSGEAPRALDAADQSGGAPLPEKAQHKFEKSLGADLGAVRVHTGAESAAAAESVGARAYTVGKDIHFGAGEYDPETNEELLAHEVAHTVQQSGHAQRQHKLEVGSTEDPAELDADAAAARMVQGAPARVTPVAAAVHRKVDPEVAEQAKELKQELKDLIAGADWWNKIRPRLYPQESAGNVAEAKERKAGNKPDLTGLGKISTLDNFAAAIKAMQPHWNAHGTHHSLNEIKKAINTELTGAGVPALKGVEIDPSGSEAKGSFQPDSWHYFVNGKLIRGNKLNDADAEELCNTTMHEARHAEQNFLAARYAAGIQNQSADDIAAQENIPNDIAAKAVEQKFDAGTDAAVAEKGKEMFDSLVTHGEENQEIENDVGKLVNKDLPAARKEAVHALHGLEHPTADKVAKAEEAMNVLSTVMEDIEKEYPQYRAIPHEADAHDVGDAAGLAFEGWPQ